MKESLDVLAIAAHPDDAELFLGGTLIKLARLGHRVGILDLTRGERGTRGSAAVRLSERDAATRIMNIAWRGNAGLPDGRLVASPAYRERVASVVRRLRPPVVMTVATDYRHPDHGAADQLAHDACFVAGLRRPGGRGPGPFRPRKFLRSTGLRGAPPDLVVDIASVYEAKRQAVRCYRSQFEAGGWGILEWVETRARYYGGLVRARYGEGFILREPLLVDDITRLEGTSF